MQLFLVVILGGLFAALTWRSPILALKIFLGVLPVYLLRFSVLSIPSTILELFFWILFIGFYAHYRPSISVRQFFLATSLFLLLTLPSVFAAPNLFSALGLWKAYLFEPVLFFVLLRFLLKQQFLSVSDLLVPLSISAIGISLFAVLQVATGFAIPVEWVMERRATSIFDYPNAVGLFLAPLISAFLIHAYITPKYRRLFLFTAFISVIGCILSQTEAVFIAIPAALFLSFIIHHAKQLTLSVKNVYTVALFGGVIAFLASLTIPFIRTKLFLQDFSGLVRRSQWQETIAMLFDRPFFGAGLGGYKKIMPDYHIAKDIEIFEYPHQLFLNVWSELGLLGLFAFLAFLLYLLYRFSNGKQSNTQLIGFAALATMCIHGLVDVPFFKNDLAFLTAAMVAIALYANEESARIEG